MWNDCHSEGVLARSIPSPCRHAEYIRLAQYKLREASPRSVVMLSASEASPPSEEILRSLRSSE